MTFCLETNRKCSLSGTGDYPAGFHSGLTSEYCFDIEQEVIDQFGFRTTEIQNLYNSTKQADLYVSITEKPISLSRVLLNFSNDNTGSLRNIDGFTTFAIDIGGLDEWPGFSQRPRIRVTDGEWTANDGWDFNWITVGRVGGEIGGIISLPNFSASSPSLTGVTAFLNSVAEVHTVFSYCFLVISCEIDATETEYADAKWTFNAKVLADNSGLSTGGRFDITGSIFNNLQNVWLCSDDCLLVDSFCVLLRTKEGQFFLTRKDRINFGKLPDKLCKDNDLRKLLLWLNGKLCACEGVLDPVSKGIIQSSTTTESTVFTQIGLLENVTNLRNLAFPSGTEVVIINLAENNNFIQILGTSKELV